jgi:hypothetical protein
MKKTEQELEQLFETQISFIFEQHRKLPNYGQPTPTFIARPRKSDTFDKIKAVLSGLKKDIVVETFKASGCAHVINFAEEAKIVIIYAKNEHDFRWKYNFHSYSASMILGKIFKSIGLKYSEDGLHYLQHDLRENHKSVVGSITLTTNFNEILDILELDVNAYSRGFTSSNEVFDWITKSPYFIPEKFINKEKEQRVFLLQMLEEYLILNKTENPNPKHLSMDKVREFFSEVPFEKLSAELLDKAHKKNSIVQKFNGRVIMDLIPGFETKKIGISMSYFKHSFTSDVDYEEFLIEHSKEEVISKFKEVNQLV